MALLRYRLLVVKKRRLPVPALVPDEPLLDAKQLAAKIGLHFVTVRRLHAEGKIPVSMWAGARPRFQLSTVYKAMQKQRRERRTG